MVGYPVRQCGSRIVERSMDDALSGITLSVSLFAWRRFRPTICLFAPSDGQGKFSGWSWSPKDLRPGIHVPGATVAQACGIGWHPRKSKT